VKEIRLELQAEALHLDVVQSLFVERVFHLVLHVEEGNKDETGDAAEDVNDPIGRSILEAMQQGWRVDEGKDVDKDLAIGPKAYGSMVRVYSDRAFDAPVDILHKAKDLESFPGANLFPVNHEKLGHFAKVRPQRRLILVAG
jgi:hypothetical protein